MSVREFVHECTRANVPALPYTTKTGRIHGRVTLKNIFKLSYLPEYIVEHARILGDQLSRLDFVESRTKQVMDSPVEAFAQEPHLTIESGTVVLKALALMEQNDTSYIFVVDNGRYHGAVTMQSLARRLSLIDQNIGE